MFNIIGDDSEKLWHRSAAGAAVAVAMLKQFHRSRCHGR
jgi:hypothetical protein